MTSNTSWRRRPRVPPHDDVVEHRAVGVVEQVGVLGPPGADLAEIVGQRLLQPVERIGARPTRTVPRCDTSNTTAPLRHARCSSIVPEGYSSGISHPPNGTILAPRRDGPRRAVSVRLVITRRGEPGGSPAASLGERNQLGVDVMLHAGQRQHVEHALAPAQDVDQLVAVAQHDLAAADHDVRRGDVGRRRGARRYSNTSRTDSERDPGVEQRLDDPQFEQVTVGVLATAPAPRRVGQRRAEQIGARPVVELPIRDADDLRRLRSAVPRSPSRPNTFLTHATCTPATPA